MTSSCRNDKIGIEIKIWITDCSYIWFYFDLIMGFNFFIYYIKISVFSHNFCMEFNFQHFIIKSTWIFLQTLIAKPTLILAFLQICYKVWKIHKKRNNTKGIIFTIHTRSLIENVPIIKHNSRVKNKHVLSLSPAVDKTLKLLIFALPSLLQYNTCIKFSRVFLTAAKQTRRYLYTGRSLLYTANTPKWYIK